MAALSILAGIPPVDRGGSEPNALPMARLGDRCFVASRCLADPVQLDEIEPGRVVLNATRDADNKHIVLKSGQLLRWAPRSWTGPFSPVS
jgi:hypothetical protein